MAPPVGLILGHSFVAGLLHHLDHNGQDNGQQLAKKLNIDNIVQEIHLHGQRGALISSPSYTLPHSLLTQVKPDFVILDLGTNDLANGTSPFTVAAQLTDLADKLRSRYHVSQVMICSVINRTSHLRTMTPQQFASAAYQCNGYLRDLADISPHTTYHVHKGFWMDPDQNWSTDGLHPNTPAGRAKYIKSIRRAVFLALESFTSS